MMPRFGPGQARYPKNIPNHVKFMVWGVLGDPFLGTNLSHENSKSGPVQRGARPARQFTHFSNLFCYFLLRLTHVSYAMTSTALVLHWLLLL